ncbi:hypothetical protein diail_310 [Diaporthe ilicicola]|nr:hypothetical protein diail_310 [Diaporthe ilicicola]
MKPVPATEFPRFLDLPFEIRWAIYELCLPTRVVDSAVHPENIIPHVTRIIEEQELALRYAVARFSSMPVICKAVPEVYRKLRRHMVAPPANEWAWTSVNKRHTKGFSDPRPLFFDPGSDVLFISVRDIWIFDEDFLLTYKTPYWLASNQDVVLAIDELTIDSFTIDKELATYCFLGRKNCTVILSETRLIKPIESIISCGLFGLFGEERTVLVDVDDFERIDYFDKKLNGQDIHPRRWTEATLMPGGVRRYGSHSTVDFQKTWTEDSPVVSTEVRALIIAKDKEEMLRRVKLAWLETNGCFEGTGQNNPGFVPSESKGYCDWDRVFDEEHPNAKPWLEKLPTFSFAVRVHAQDLEECARLWGAELTRESKMQRRRRETRS